MSLFATGNDAGESLPDRAARGSFTTLKQVGYWLGPHNTMGLPEVRDFIEPDWSPVERAQVLDYLRERSWVKHAWTGPSMCRLCGQANGNECHTDGTWVWPEGLAHYLEEHQVKPAQEFVDYVLQRLAFLNTPPPVKHEH